MMEVLIVAALIAVLASIAMPRVSFVDLRLDANVRIVRSVVQQAWRTSIQKQHDVLLSFNVAGHSMRIVEDENNDGQPSAGERVSWRPLEEGVRFGVPPAGVLGNVTAEVTGPGVRTVTSYPTVTFRRNGSTSGDAEVYLTAARRGGSGWRALTLAQSTGRTEWFRQVSGTWRQGGI